MQTAPTALDERYGRTSARRRRGLITSVVATAVLVAAVGAWALWSGIGGAATALEADTVAASVDSAAFTTVRWQVTGRPDTPLVCDIQAQDGSGVVVGLVEQVVPVTGSTDRTGTTTVRTVRRASAGLIASCRDA